MVFRHKKRLGQNFIDDKAVLQQIVETAQVRPGDKILEIGPGQGTLSQMLLEVNASVLAVEIDEQLAKELSRRFSKERRFSLITSDFLSKPLTELLAKAGWEKESYSVVANIPYYITAPIIKKLLTEDPRPKKLTLLVQKEVAKRLAGEESDRSLLSVMAHYYAEVSLGPVISREHFTPVPKVDSQVVIFLPKRKYDAEEDRRFFRLVKAGFSNRRKTLANNLGTLPEFSKEAVEGLLREFGWSPKVRAQELSIEDWNLLQERLGALMQEK